MTGQGSFHGENSVLEYLSILINSEQYFRINFSHLGQRGSDELRVGVVREEELPVVLPVDGLPSPGLLVFGVHQQLVVHSLHHDLLRGVLTHVEPQLQLLAAGVVLVLDERRLEALEPGRVSCGIKVTGEVLR